MKTIKKIIVISIISISAVISCSKDQNVDSLSITSLSKQNALIETRGELNTNNSKINFLIKDNRITKKLVPAILASNLDNNEFKDPDNYSINTVSRDGRELIHVVNFNKGGWAIVSGLFKVDNVILAFSGNGEFNPDEIESPEVRFWFEMTKSIIEQEIIETESVPERVSRDSSFFDEPYAWIRIPLGDQHSSTEISRVDPLVETSWGQRFPWYYKTPSRNGEKCSLGCFPVAAAQMILYLHTNIGYPAGRYRQIDTSFTWVTTDYSNNDGHFISNVTRSDYSTNWYSMALESPGVQCAVTNYVGDFILDVGDRFNTEYSSISSTSINSYGNFQNFDLTCSLMDYNSYSDINTIVSNLNDDLPVIMNGWQSRFRNNPGSTDYMGHSWIIDGYKQYRNTTDNQYYLMRIPTESLYDYNYLGYDMILTDLQKEYSYPGVNEYEIIHNYSYSYSYLFNMNWGWDGLYDGFYATTPSSWNPEGTYAYQFLLKLLYNFEALE